MVRISISVWGSVAIALWLALTVEAADPATVDPPPPVNVLSDQINSLIVSGITALAETDDPDLKAVCQELQKELQGEQVLDLAALRDVARTVLPLMEQDEETKPYAAWLRARLDYLDVADELRISVPAPTPEHPSRPSAAIIRKKWQEHLQREALSPRVSSIVLELKPIFRMEKIPPELVWLGEVESGFDARALSPAGAAGMFQLMPETARTLELSLHPFDQRYNVEKSAHGAARYLKYLHGKFGDWRLALAAYNAGEGRVRRLLDNQRSKTFDAISPHLPAETQMYVPKIEAVVLRREGVALTDLKIGGDRQ